MKKPASKHYHEMLKITEILTPVTSVTCLLVDNPLHYAQPLLHSLSSNAVSTNAKMLVVLKSATNIDPLCWDLTRSTIEFDMKPGVYEA